MRQKTSVKEAARERGWAKLAPGDIVDVVAPASRCTDEELKGAIKFLKSWDLVPRVPRGIFKKHFLHSHEDEFRLKTLREALAAPDSKAVWCLRGGYGSVRLLPELSRMRQPRTSKVFIGISDITSLHLFLNQKWGWPTLHASMLGSLGAGRTPKAIQDELYEILMGKATVVAFRGLRACNARAKSCRTLRGSLRGGNLVTLQSSLGTKFALDTRGHFLFLEEIGERGYRVDRILEHLRQAGSLKGCRGVLFGDFIGGEEPGGKEYWSQAIRRFAALEEYPVYSGVPSGHGTILRAVPLGTPAILENQGGRALLSVATGRL
jgi:muramoyltetrapeptide carboxypeptidase